MPISQPEPTDGASLCCLDPASPTTKRPINPIFFFVMIAVTILASSSKEGLDRAAAGKMGLPGLLTEQYNGEVHL
jgi:hypothetical protein